WGYTPTQKHVFELAAAKPYRALRATAAESVPSRRAATAEEVPMRKLALLSALSAVLLATAVAAAGTEGGSKRLPTSGTVWAVERFDGGQNTLAAFDAATGEVLGVVPIGRRPIGVTAPHGTGKVYTADERSNQLSVLSKADFTIIKQIPTGAASFPHHVMASPNGKLVYFGRYNTNTVGVVDTSSDEMVATW